MKRAIYVDYENVNIHGLEAIEKLGSDDYVKIFIGTQTTRLSMEDANRIFNCEAHVELITNKYIGKNALDFIIMVYMGYDIAKELAGAYFVVSNDKGYDPAIYQMRKLSGCTVLRKSDISFVLREKLSGGSVPVDRVAPLDVIIEKEPVMPVKSEKESEKKTGVRRLLGIFGIGKKVQEEVQPEPAEVTTEEIETERIVVNKNLQDESLKEKIYSEFVADNSGNRRGSKRGGRTNKDNNTGNRRGNKEVSTGNKRSNKESGIGNGKKQAAPVGSYEGKQAGSDDNQGTKQSSLVNGESIGNNKTPESGKQKGRNSRVKNLVNIDLKPDDGIKNDRRTRTSRNNKQKPETAENNNVQKSEITVKAESQKPAVKTKNQKPEKPGTIDEKITASSNEEGKPEESVKTGNTESREALKSDKEKQISAVRTERNRTARSQKNRQEKPGQPETKEGSAIHPEGEDRTPESVNNAETVVKQEDRKTELPKTKKPAFVVKFNSVSASDTKSAEEDKPANSGLNVTADLKENSEKKAEPALKNISGNKTEKALNQQPQKKSGNIKDELDKSPNGESVTAEKETPVAAGSERNNSVIESEINNTETHRKTNRRNKNRRKTGGKNPVVLSENKDAKSFPVSPEVLSADPVSSDFPLLFGNKEQLTEIKPDEIEFPDDKKPGRRRNNRRRGRGGQNAEAVINEKNQKSPEELQREKDRAEAFALLAALDEEENKRKPTVYRPNRRKNNS